MNTDFAERDFRWQRVYKFMDEHGFDGLLVFGSSDGVGADRYLTNDRPNMHVVFPRHGNITALAGTTQFVVQNLLSRERGEDTWLEDIRVAFTGVTLADILREKGLDKKKVGVVGIGSKGDTMHLNSSWVPYRTWASLKESLPTAVFEGVTEEFIIFMLERSPQDIVHLRRAAATGEEACKAMIEVARVGATESDVYAAGMCAFHKSGVNIAGMMLQSGPEAFAWGRPMWLYRAQPPRVLQEGDIVLAELFPHYGGVEAQLQLAIAIGKVYPDNEKCAEVARKAYEAGLAVIKPGVLFSQVCDAMEQPVREIGGWHVTPMIHTVNPAGLVSSFALDIEKQIPEIEHQYSKIHGRLRSAEFELKPGMSFASEPNCQFGRHRVNIGGTIIVTETGTEELNKIPNNLQRVPG